MWNNCCRLIESDPDTAGERAGVTCEPRIFVIVGGAGLTCRRQLEAERPCTCRSALSKNFFNYLGSHPCRARIQRRLRDVRGVINRFVLLIIIALDDVSLFAISGIGK